MDELFDLPSPTDPFTWALVAGMLTSRGLDFLSTWLVTPKLVLEANPLARRVHWAGMMLLNLPLLGLPLVHHGLSITFIVTSLLAAGANLANGALAKGAGERRQAEHQARAIRKLGLGKALLMNSSGSLITCLGGAFLMVLTERAESPAWWGGLGVVMFGVAGLVHLNLAILRVGRKARRLDGR